MHAKASLPGRILASILLLARGLNAAGAQPGEKLWEFETGGELDVWPPAIGDDGTVYISASSSNGVGVLHALNGTTGQELWSAVTGSNDGFFPSAPAIGPDGSVLVASSENGLRALSGVDGQRLWEFDRGRGWPLSPAIGADGTVYAWAGDPRSVYALDGATGVAVWNSQTPRAFWRSLPTIGPDGTVYLGIEPILLALDGESGQERWRYRFDELATIASSAIGAEGTVYVVVNSASVGDPSKPGVYALDGATGALLWMNPQSDLRGASLAIGIDGTVYVSAAQLLALEGTTGTQRWVSGAKYSWYSNSAIAADGTIYAGTADGHLYALNAATGETVWEFATDGATGSPTILDDGTVLVGARHGTVYAIQGTSGLAPSPWPKFQGDPQNSGRLYRFLQVGTLPPLVVLPEGNASRLECSVKGRPLPALKWSRNGLEIPNATNAVLSLPQASRDMEGIYRLTAANGVEEAERTITVVVSNVQTEDFPAWQWTSDGKALVLEQGPSLAGPWSDLAMFDAGETTGFHVETNPVGPARFYRLRGNASARFTVSGTARGWTFHDTPGTRHLIEYVDAEHGWTHWQTLTTLTLPASPYMFVDQDSLGSPERVYRTTPE